MADNVKDQTGLVKRNGIYYFRARISKEIGDHFGGKTEVIKSLSTRDKKAAQAVRKASRLNTRPSEAGKMPPAAGRVTEFGPRTAAASTTSMTRTKAIRSGRSDGVGATASETSLWNR